MTRYADVYDRTPGAGLNPFQRARLPLGYVETGVALIEFDSTDLLIFIAVVDSELADARERPDA